MNAIAFRFSRLVSLLSALLLWPAVAGAQQASAGGFEYPDAYKVKPLAEQQAVLLKHFPRLKQMNTKVPELPEGAEGWFAIPRWQRIAPTYGEALSRVFAALAKSREGHFHDYRKGQLGARFLRQEKQSKSRWDRLVARQRGDIVAVPAQFGRRYRGWSANDVRAKLEPDQFSLGAYQIAIMLLTHPERLSTGGELWLYAPGDEYSYGGDGHFEFAPLFYFRAGELGFDAIFAGGAYDVYGSASGILAR